MEEAAWDQAELTVGQLAAAAVWRSRRSLADVAAVLALLPHAHPPRLATYISMLADRA